MSTHRLRVLQVIGSMDVGGQERVVARLARGLDKSRFDVRVCCTRSLGTIADELIAESVDVRLATPHSRRLRHLTPWWVRRAILEQRPDILHTHGTVSVLHVGPLPYIWRLPPWIHTFHYGNYAAVRGRMWEMERLFTRRITRMAAVSEAQRQSVIARYEIPEPRIMTIVNGVGGNPHLRDADVRRRKRAELGFAPDDLVIGTIAVLSEQKGITYLLSAATQLLARHPRARIVVVGGGPLEGPLRAQAEQLGLGDRVMFTSWRSDNLEILCALDMFVMPSLWEAMPLALLEAMSTELPIVATNVSDNRLVLANGDCGLLVPARDPDALASAIDRLLSGPDTAAAMARRAHIRFTEHYTADHMLRAYENLYEETVSSAERL